jgi:amino acid adenylation domain-containing protein/non-ribosomal peptide synthase protein (TIGR01720 family)
MQTEKDIAGVRLSPQQMRLWALQRSDRQVPYCVQGAVRIEGVLRPEILKRVVSELVARHEILHTTYDVEGTARLIPLVDSARAFTFDQYELSGLSAPEQETEIAALFAQERQRPFDLQQGPLVRLCLVRQAASLHTLLVNLHALCADVATLKNFIKEISAHYASQPEGVAAVAETLQYADFSEWQAELIESEDARKESEYWRRQLKASLLSVRLPYETLPAPGETFTPERHSVRLSPQNVTGIEALAARYQVPVSLFLSACWQVLLGRLTGQADLMIGTAFDGRNYDELKSALGTFTKYVPLGVGVAGRMRFADYLKQLHEKTNTASELQEYFSWQSLCTDDHKFAPEDFFSFIFDFEDYGESYSHTANLSFSIDKCDACLERYKLRLSCARTADGLIAEYHYDAALLRQHDIERLAREFQTLLSDVLANPEADLDTLNILSDVDRHELLFNLNSTKSDYPRQTPVHELFEAQAERTPEQVAVSFEEIQLSYRELNERANQLAHHLQSIGVRPEVPVGLCVERSVEMVVGLLGILKAGGAYVPLDPSYPLERLAFMLEDADVRLVLTLENHVKNLPHGSAKTFCLDTDRHLLAPYSQANPRAAVDAGNLMYVIYTSGSTGKAKGVMVTHRSACNRLWWSQSAYPLDAQDRVLQIASVSFDFSVWEIFGPLLAGAQIVLAQPGGHQDSTYLVSAIRKYEVTSIHFVPSMLQVFLSEPGVEELHSLKRVFCGGEVLPTPLQQRFRSLLAAQLYNQYGPTETTVDVTFRLCTSENERPTIPIGRPVANTQAYILDALCEPLSIGLTGELYIGGDNLARGYLNRPELTAEKFIPHPFADEPGARLYRTGDLAHYLSGGEIEFAGRVDDQIKLRGFRIELGEIEVVLRQHPTVADAAVNVLEDAHGHKRLIAYTATKAQHTPLTPGEWRTYIEELLPEYMIPSAFVILDTLPLTPNGKIDRRALPAPDDSRPALDSQYSEPRTPAEHTLVEIWAQVLGVTQVGIHDNFFELGGDSILSIQIIARANRNGLRLTPRQLFLHQTVAGLASVVGTSASVKAEQGLVSGEATLTPIQRLFFAWELADPHHFNQALMLKVKGGTDGVLLKKALQHVLEHHDALRMRYTQDATGWRQANDGAETLSWQHISLRHLSSEEQRTAALEAEAAQAQSSLHLSQGPLLRALHFDLGTDEPDRLLLIIHHLCVDAVSWRILLEDLEHAYTQLRAGEKVALPAKTTSYKQWAAELVKAAQSKAVQAEVEYWTKQAWNEAQPLPVDFAGGSNQVSEARSLTVRLNETETSALLREVPEAYQTQINEVLVTALGRALRKWGMSGSGVVEMEGHGREEVSAGVDVTRTVGWFTSVYPVLVGGSGQEEVGAELKRVKEELRRIANRGVGYGMLRYLSEDERVRAEMERIPQGEMSFNYLGQFDQVTSKDGVAQLAEEYAGPLQSERGTRRYLLTVDSMVTGGKLEMSWTYSVGIHRQATIERLAAGYIKSLQEIIAHCKSPAARGFTPSDFPEANLSQAELDILISSISKNQLGARK